MHRLSKDKPLFADNLLCVGQKQPFLKKKSLRQSYKYESKAQERSGRDDVLPLPTSYYQDSVKLARCFRSVPAQGSNQYRNSQFLLFFSWIAIEIYALNVSFLIKFTQQMNVCIEYKAMLRFGKKMHLLIQSCSFTYTIPFSLIIIFIKYQVVLCIKIQFNSMKPDLDSYSGILLINWQTLGKIVCPVTLYISNIVAQKVKIKEILTSSNNTYVIFIAIFCIF